jgi:hypothetical protein
MIDSLDIYLYDKIGIKKAYILKLKLGSTVMEQWLTKNKMK